MREQINNLLNSDVSGYKIRQDTGLSQTIISDLRLGRRKLDNLTLKSAEILSNYADEVFSFKQIVDDCISEILLSDSIELTDEDVLKGKINDDYKLHYIDYGNAIAINVFHMNGKNVNEFRIRDIKSAEFAVESLKFYR